MQNKKGSPSKSKIPTVNAFLQNQTNVSRYKIVAELGRGGMGTVYRAFDTQLGREVALKTIHHHKDNPQAVRRFIRETQAMITLHHPNIVRVYDAGISNGRYYYTMDLIEGQTLSILLKMKLVTTHRALEVMAKVSKAMHYAHQQGILHRDLKPSNIMVDNSWEPYIMDFGLAKEISHDDQLSKTGEILGTPTYMSPEQALGKKHKINALSDVYSLGATLYEALSKSPPFRGTAHSIFLQIVQNDPVSPSELDRKISKELDAICLKAMEKNPQRRYQNAELLAQDLQNYLDGKPVQAKSLGPTYRLYKWGKRHPVILLSLTLGFVGLSATTILFFILLLQGQKLAEQEKQTAEQQKIMIANLEDINKKQQQVHQQIQVEHYKSVLRNAYLSLRLLKSSIRELDYQEAYLNYEKERTKIQNIEKEIYETNNIDLIERLKKYQLLSAPLYKYGIFPYFEKSEQFILPAGFYHVSSAYLSWKYAVINQEKSSMTYILDLEKFLGNTPFLESIVDRFQTNQQIFCYSVSAEQRYIVLSDSAGNIYLWDSEKTGIQNQYLFTSRIPDKKIYSICFTHADSVLVSSRASSKILKLPSFEIIQEGIAVGGERSSGNTLSPDGRYIIGNQGEEIGIWDIAKKSFARISNYKPLTISFRPKDDFTFTHNENNVLQAVTMNSNYSQVLSRKTFIDRHKGDIAHACWSHDGNFLVTLQRGGNLVMWHFDSGNAVFKTSVESDSADKNIFSSSVFHPSEPKLIVFTSQKITILHFPSFVGKKLNLREHFQESRGALQIVEKARKSFVKEQKAILDNWFSVSLSAKQHVAFNVLAFVFVWDTLQDKVVQVPFDTITQVIKRVEFSPDGNFLVIAKKDYTDIWDVQTMTKVLSSKYQFVTFTQHQDFFVILADPPQKLVFLNTKGQEVYALNNIKCPSANLGAAYFRDNLLFTISNQGLYSALVLDHNGWNRRKDIKIPKGLQRVTTACLYGEDHLALGNEVGRMFLINCKTGKIVFQKDFYERIRNIHFSQKLNLFWVVTDDSIYIHSLNEDIFLEDGEKPKVYPIRVYGNYQIRKPTMDDNVSHISYMVSENETLKIVLQKLQD